MSLPSTSYIDELLISCGTFGIILLVDNCKIALWCRWWSTAVACVNDKICCWWLSELVRAYKTTLDKLSMQEFMRLHILGLCISNMPYNLCLELDEHSESVNWTRNLISSCRSSRMGNNAFIHENNILPKRAERDRFMWTWHDDILTWTLFYPKLQAKFSHTTTDASFELLFLKTSLTIYFGYPYATCRKIYEYADFSALILSVLIKISHLTNP